MMGSMGSPMMGSMMSGGMSGGLPGMIINFIMSLEPMQTIVTYLSDKIGGLLDFLMPTVEGVLPILNDLFDQLKPPMESIGLMIRDLVVPSFKMLVVDVFGPLLEELPEIAPYLKQCAPEIKLIGEGMSAFADLLDRIPDIPTMESHQLGGVALYTGSHQLHKGEIVLGQTDSQYVFQEMLFSNMYGNYILRDLLDKLKRR